MKEKSPSGGGKAQSNDLRFWTSWFMGAKLKTGNKHQGLQQMHRNRTTQPGGTCKPQPEHRD